MSLTAPAPVAAFDLGFLSRIIWGVKPQTTSIPSTDEAPRFPVAPDPGEAPLEAAEADGDLNSGVPGYVAGGAYPDIASRLMIQHADGLTRSNTQTQTTPDAEG